MHVVGIRELKQNASAGVADAAGGETGVISDRGRPVARMTPLPRSAWAGLVEAGLAHEPMAPLSSIPYPVSGPKLSEVLGEDRGEDRY